MTVVEFHSKAGEIQMCTDGVVSFFKEGGEDRETFLLVIIITWANNPFQCMPSYYPPPLKLCLQVEVLLEREDVYCIGANALKKLSACQQQHISQGFRLYRIIFMSLKKL